MLALYLDFRQICFEVFHHLAQIVSVALLKGRTMTDDTENAKSPSKYSLFLKYLSFDK